MDVWKFAWRNVWRNQRRTLVTVAAMSLALLVMILYAGLMEGYFRDMERNVLDLEVGDVQIHAEDYRNNPSLYTRIEDPDTVLAPLEAAGYPASARVLAWGLAAAGDASAGVSFRGVDIAQDAQVSRVHEQVSAGRWLDPEDPKGVVLGRRIAHTLSVAPGDEILALTQGADGALAYDLFIVRGVLRGIGDATDRTGLFVVESTLRELLVVPEGVHQIIVRRPAEVELAAAAARIQQLAHSHDVQTWRQLLPTIATMMDSARGVMIVMFVIVYVAIAILILNAMLMAVFERIREIGVLKALGVGPLGVLAMVLCECAIQTALAIVIGVALAIPALLYLTRFGIDLGTLAGTSVLGIAMDPIWRAAVAPQTFTVPIGVLVLIVAVAVLYPALKAALIRPVDAIHHH